MVRPALELKHSFLLALLLASYALITGNAQDQTGFISIDCGLESNISSYNENKTAITYVSDSRFIDTGESRTIAEKYRDLVQQQIRSLRRFPEGNRNCYRIEVLKGTKYLIRADFFYGDHDGQGMPPAFDLHLGPNLWASIKIEYINVPSTEEIIHVARRNYVHVCLVNTGQGVPFVSAIELRPLDDLAYQTQLGSLQMYSRADSGSSLSYRYGTGGDVHDRFWYSNSNFFWKNISTNLSIDSQGANDHYNIPSIVMSTAATPKDPNASLDIWWQVDSNTTTHRYFYMHFAEIELLGHNESREFNIFYNGEFFHGPVSPSYLQTTTVSTPTPFSGSLLNFSLARTESSTRPPIINAFEMYTLKEFPLLESDQQDVDAITKLKTTYGLRRNWQGDPCAPKEYSWEGLTCTYDGSPRIISLNLSASELTGEIAPSIANLSMIEVIDLSNNNFTGSVPDFLSKLPNLKNLNLENNQLIGSVPVELIEKHNNGFLSLSVNGNPNLCASVSCREKKSAPVLVVAISVAGSLVLMLFIAIAWWVLRRKRQHCVAEANANARSTFDEYSVGSRKRKFKFSEIEMITNNFEKVIGKGAFGTVYHGRIDDNQVAVKMLSPSTVQGYRQFQAEVDILLRVYHRNLTTLVGYFNDENRAGLVYEYMANGDLQSHLSDQNNSTATILKWEDRLRIAIDAGQGLEYLHQGCKPPIVHRDIKSANILLNENFQAKLSDFGISKTFPSDSNASYVSTVVAGTPGYLDPQYYKSNRLNEKSDVYSFGVLLLEIITGRPAISKQHGNTRLGEWVASMLERGLIDHTIDPRLQGNFHLNSAWKFVETAMNCTSESSANRPNMGEVVGELKACLEMTRIQEAKGRDLRGLSETILSDQMSMTQPSVR